MDRLVIGLSGFKRSGKDMVAKYLREYRGFGRIAFADPLKEMASEEYNVPLSFFYDDDKKEAPLLQYPVNFTDTFIQGVCDLLINEFRSASGRRPIKLISNGMNTVGEFQADDGTHYFDDAYWTGRALAIFKGSGNRAVNTAYWNEKAVECIEASMTKLIVIPDLRFKTEVAYMKKCFGKNFVTVRIDRFETVNTTDPSEIDLIDHVFDYRIDNSQNKNISKQKVFYQMDKILDDIVNKNG